MRRDSPLVDVIMTKGQVVYRVQVVGGVTLYHRDGESFEGSQTPQNEQMWARSALQHHYKRMLKVLSYAINRIKTVGLHT